MNGLDLEIKANRIEDMDVRSPMFIGTEIVQENGNGTRLKLQISYNLDVTEKSIEKIREALKGMNKSLRRLR